MKGAVSAQKTLQGSETFMRQLLGGTEDNCVVDFLHKRKQGKIELVARPVSCRRHPVCGIPCPKVIPILFYGELEVGNVEALRVEYGDGVTVELLVSTAAAGGGGEGRERSQGHGFGKINFL